MGAVPPAVAQPAVALLLLLLLLVVRETALVHEAERLLAGDLGVTRKALGAARLLVGGLGVAWQALEAARQVLAEAPVAVDRLAPLPGGVDPTAESAPSPNALVVDVQVRSDDRGDGWWLWPSTWSRLSYDRLWIANAMQSLGTAGLSV